MVGELRQTLSDLENENTIKGVNKMEILTTIGSILGVVVAALVSFLITFKKTMKAKKGVQTEADEAKAIAAVEAAKNAINAEIERLVQVDETAYAALDGLLKTNQKGTAGSIKFRDVLLSLHDFCLDNGYTWNEEEMTKAITDKVAFTKTVNSK